jgi:hypothetical protein
MTGPAPALRQDPRIFVAMPAYGGMIHAAFAESLLRSVAELRIDIGGRPRPLIGHYGFINNDALVNRARNNFAAEFLRGIRTVDGKGAESLTQFEWLLFLDTDLVFAPADIERLFRVAQRSGPGIYAGGYALKRLQPGFVYNPQPGAVPDAEGVLEVREAGSGFMLIHREVFARMAERYRDEIAYETDRMDGGGGGGELRHDFFTVGVRFDPAAGRKRFLSEDWYFCQRWLEMGGRIRLHTGIRCGHIGAVTNPVPAAELLAAADRLRPA